jgi:hypothetical protein
MFTDDGSLFDGLEEVHSQYERGESYGLERQTYARMAQCAIACSSAGVEPSTIRQLANGKPGCDLTLYGSQAAYTIRVEEASEDMSSDEAFVIRLFVIGLDVKYIPLTPGHLVFEAEDTFRNWFKVMTTILGYQFENTEPLTLGDVTQAYEASENIDKWLW